MIEAAAGPEMAAMGYPAAAQPESAISQYRDPFEAIHPKFPRDYSADPRRIDDEIQRLRILASPGDIPEPVARRWFIYPEAYRRLRHSIGH